MNSPTVIHGGGVWFLLVVSRLSSLFPLLPHTNHFFLEKQTATRVASNYHYIAFLEEVINNV